MRLASPSTQLKSRYEVVVIGSGYGGAVMAARLARQGFEVCVLERGGEYQPGDYPSTAAELVGNTQLELKGKRHGPSDALFRFVVDDEHGALVGCGLGGTSLINAGVALRPPEAQWSDPRWPTGLRDDLPRLHACYERAERELEPQLASARSIKARALAKAGQAAPVPLAIDASRCNACGDCITGCNRGAKNTLLTNYLPQAVEAGARIFCSVEVQRLERRAAGWRVHFGLGGLGREKFERTPLSVDARYVVVAAGALGSTELLLRSKAHGVAISDQLGQRFSGNGTVLGFTVKGPRAEARPGPTIESMLDGRSHDGVVVQDTTVPGPLRGAAAAMLGQTDPSRVHAWSVTAGDDSRGTLSLGAEGQGVRIAWPGAGRSAHVEAAHRELERISESLGGEFKPNPMWAALPKAPLLATHPLGGCAMADDAADGVVNHKGQVFGFDDLYVCDGSTLPGSFGTNPLLTLCALAERCAELFCMEHVAERARTAPHPVPDTTGFRFTERMTGFISESWRPVDGLKKPADAEALTFLLTIEWPSLDALVEDPSTPARTLGTVRAPSLSAEPLRVLGGSFQLFVGAGTERRMLHRMTLEGGGRTLRLEGVKIIRDDPGPDLWFDSRSLFVTVYEGDRPIAHGLLQTSPLDLLKQVTTLQGTRTGLRGDLAARARFLRLFLGTLRDVYGGLVLPLVR